MELARVPPAGGPAQSYNITAEAQILSYVYAGTAPIEVIARVDLGDTNRPIAGGGNYTINFYLNDVLVTPQTVDAVPAGKHQTIVSSRPVAIYASDAVTIRVTGQPADTTVNIVASLRTATPLQLSDLLGSGTIPVDHNYGGTNALAYRTSLGAGVAGATVLAYRTSDYNGGNTGNAFVVGRTVTTLGGAWQAPLYLNPGGYTLVFYLPGQYGVDTATITV